MAEFMMLPPEVRLMIYHYLVDNTSGKRMVCGLERGSRSGIHAKFYSASCPRRLGSVDHKSHAFGSCYSNPYRYLHRSPWHDLIHHAPVGDIVSLMRTGRILHQEAEPVLYQRLDLVIIDGFDENFEKSLEDGLLSNIISANTRGMICDIRIDQNLAYSDYLHGFERPGRYRQALSCLAKLLPSLQHLSLGIEVSPVPQQVPSSLEVQGFARALSQVCPGLFVMITWGNLTTHFLDAALDLDVGPGSPLKGAAAYAVFEVERLRRALHDAKQERLQHIHVDQRDTGVATN